MTAITTRAGVSRVRRRGEPSRGVLERRRPRDRTEGGEPRSARDEHPRDQTHDHVEAPARDDCCGRGRAAPSSCIETIEKGDI